MIALGHFNFEHFNKYLVKALIPAIYIEDDFHFENINFLCGKDIKSLDIFVDYFIDINLEKVDFKHFFIYPQWRYPNIKYKFKDIEILLKFIKTITEEL